MQKKFLIPAANGRKVPLWVMYPDATDLTSKENILLFFCHGVGENSNSRDDMEWLDYYRSNGPQALFNGVQQSFNGKNFILIAPQLSKWDAGINSAPDQRNGTWPAWYLDTVYEWALKTYPSDPQRRPLAGLSYGGGGLISYVTSNPARGKYFSAIVDICGINGITDGWENIKNVPIAFCHAMDDNTVPYYGNTYQAVAAINALNPTIKPLVWLPQYGGHGIWDRVFVRGGTEFPFWDFCYNNKFLTQVVTPPPVIDVITPAPPPYKKDDSTPVVNVPADMELPIGSAATLMAAADSKAFNLYWEQVGVLPSKTWRIKGDSKTQPWVFAGLEKPGIYEFQLTGENEYGVTVKKTMKVYYGVKKNPPVLESYQIKELMSDGSIGRIITVGKDQMQEFISKLQ